MKVGMCDNVEDETKVSDVVMAVVLVFERDVLATDWHVCSSK